LSKAHNDLGFITAADNHPAEAIPYFKMAIQTNPQNAKAYFNLADALVATGSPQEAVLYYLKALDVQPDFMEACAHLALTYETLGKWDEAVATGEKAIRFARAQGHSNVAKNIELWLQDFRAQHPQLQNKLPPPPAPAQ
jgi:diamine N-acetyltransferase